MLRCTVFVKTMYLHFVLLMHVQVQVLNDFLSWIVSIKSKILSSYGCSRREFLALLDIFQRNLSSLSFLVIASPQKPLSGISEWNLDVVFASVSSCTSTERNLVCGQIWQFGSQPGLSVISHWQACPSFLDLFVSCDDPLMSKKTFTRPEQLTICFEP